MEDQRVKKSFVQRNKKVITFVGVAILAVASVYGAGYVYRKIFMKGFTSGAIISFEATIEWLNKEFPEIKLKELYDEWVRLHPEQMVEWKF